MRGFDLDLLSRAVNCDKTGDNLVVLLEGAIKVTLSGSKQSVTGTFSLDLSASPKCLTHHLRTSMRLA